MSQRNEQEKKKKKNKRKKGRKKKKRPVQSFPEPQSNIQTSIRPATPPHPTHPHPPPFLSSSPTRFRRWWNCKHSSSSFSWTDERHDAYVFLSFLFSPFLFLFSFSFEPFLLTPATTADLRNSRPTTTSTSNGSSNLVGLSGQEREGVSRRCGCRALPCGNTSPRYDH